MGSQVMLLYYRVLILPHISTVAPMTVCKSPTYLLKTEKLKYHQVAAVLAMPVRVGVKEPEQKLRTETKELTELLSRPCCT